MAPPMLPHLSLLLALLALLALLVGCGPEASEARDLVLVAEGTEGRLRWLDREDGSEQGSACLMDHFADTCASGRCQLWGFLPEVVGGVDRLTVAYERPPGPDSGALGGLLRLELGAPGEVAMDLMWLDFGVHLAGAYGGVCDEPGRTSPCRMEAPHAVACNRAGLYVVADTFLDRLLFLESERRDGDDWGVVRGVLDATTTEAQHWQDCRGVNNVEVLERDGRELALVSCKGLHQEQGDVEEQGHLALWDISDLDDVQHLWRFPAEGFLRAVHHGNVVASPEGSWLVYGHSLGATGAEEGAVQRGTVGFARFDADGPPVYLGDGVVPAAAGAFGFTPAVTELPDGTGLLVTDSGCERPVVSDCDNPGLVYEVSWPELSPEGPGGTWTEDGADQVFVELEVLRSFEGLVDPYEAEVLPADSIGQTLRTEGAVQCLQE